MYEEDDCLLHRRQILWIGLFFNERKKLEKICFQVCFQSSLMIIVDFVAFERGSACFWIQALPTIYRKDFVIYPSWLNHEIKSCTFCDCLITRFSQLSDLEANSQFGTINSITFRTSDSNERNKKGSTRNFTVACIFTSMNEIVSSKMCGEREMRTYVRVKSKNKNFINESEPFLASQRKSRTV